MNRLGIITPDDRFIIYDDKDIKRLMIYQCDHGDVTGIECCIDTMDNIEKFVWIKRLIISTERKMFVYDFKELEPPDILGVENAEAISSGV